MFHRTFPIVETTHTGGVLDCDTHNEILNKLCDTHTGQYWSTD